MFGSVEFRPKYNGWLTLTNMEPRAGRLDDAQSYTAVTQHPTFFSVHWLPCFTQVLFRFSFSSQLSFHPSPPSKNHRSVTHSTVSHLLQTTCDVRERSATLGWTSAIASGAGWTDRRTVSATSSILALLPVMPTYLPPTSNTYRISSSQQPWGCENKIECELLLNADRGKNRRKYENKPTCILTLT